MDTHVFNMRATSPDLPSRNVQVPVPPLMLCLREEISRQLQAAEERHAREIASLRGELRLLKQRLEIDQKKSPSRQHEACDLFVPSKMPVSHASCTDCHNHIEDGDFEKTLDDGNVNGDWLGNLTTDIVHPGNYDCGADTVQLSSNSLHCSSPCGNKKRLGEKPLDRNSDELPDVEDGKVITEYATSPEVEVAAAADESDTITPSSPEPLRRGWIDPIIAQLASLRRSEPGISGGSSTSSVLSDISGPIRQHSQLFTTEVISDGEGTEKRNGNADPLLEYAVCKDTAILHEEIVGDEMADTDLLRSAADILASSALQCSDALPEINVSPLDLSAADIFGIGELLVTCSVPSHEDSNGSASVPNADMPFDISSGHSSAAAGKISSPTKSTKSNPCWAIPRSVLLKTEKRARESPALPTESRRRSFNAGVHPPAQTQPKTFQTYEGDYKEGTFYDDLLRMAGSGEHFYIKVLSVDDSSPAAYVWLDKQPVLDIPREVKKMNTTLSSFHSKLAGEQPGRFFGGQPVAVHRGKNEWVRGRTLAVKDDQAVVFEVDMGTSVEVHCRSICALEPRFLSTKVLALRVRIAGLELHAYGLSQADELRHLLISNDDVPLLATIVSLEPVPVIRIQYSMSVPQPIDVITFLNTSRLKKEGLDVRMGLIVHVPRSCASHHFLLVDLAKIPQMKELHRKVTHNRRKIPFNARLRESRSFAVERHGSMYRAFFVNTPKDGRVFVELMDYGHRFYTTLENVYELPEEISKLPPAAYMCSLTGSTLGSTQEYRGSPLHMRLKSLLHKVVVYRTVQEIEKDHLCVQLWDEHMRLVSVLGGSNAYPMESLSGAVPAMPTTFKEFGLWDPYRIRQIIPVSTAAVIDSTAESALVAVFPAHDRGDGGVERMMIDDAMQCECPKMPACSTIPEKNVVVCVFSNAIKRWHRGLVANPNVVEESVTIYLLDDGRVEEVTIKDLRPMRREWMVTPSKSLLLVVKDFVFAVEKSKGEWHIEEEIPLDQIVSHRKYSFMVTSVEENILHGILINE